MANLPSSNWNRSSRLLYLKNLVSSRSTARLIWWKWWLISISQFISCWFHIQDSSFLLFIKLSMIAGLYLPLRSIIFASVGLLIITTAQGTTVWWLLYSNSIIFRPFISPSSPFVQSYCWLSSLLSIKRSYPFKRLGKHGSTTQQKTSYSNDLEM